jgi:hypothetical protein
MWASFSAYTKFSIIGFGVSLALGLFSMGVWGYGLYYLVKPVLGNRIDELQGDTLWPSVIMAGMLSSIGFLIAGVTMHFLTRTKLPSIGLNLIYSAILWFWLLLLWWWIIEFRIVK